MITGLQHVAVYSKDIETTKDFYVRGLGFTITWEGMVKVKTGFTHAVTCSLGTCILELVQPPILDNVHSVAGPVQHFALSVDNLDKTICELAAKGIEVVESKEYLTYEGGIVHAFIYGPSNERIELVQKTGPMD